ncbi:carbohydrate ABC transporter permease [uncultured Nocardioides sp.]|uniref:carbohydrate ABC transporter permease n=1 Tax=uncultured Nocardioides sp. TaxID=198441 RepID=UPI002627DA9E|nr:sugar ABC transporter permease [uncultured Nocardioides sp.]
MSGPVSGPTGRRHPDTRAAWAFLAPNAVLIVLFLLVPLGWAFVLSFQAKRPFGPGTWTGFDNLTRLLADDVFWRAALNTAVFTAVTVPLMVVLGLAVALLLDKAMPGRTIARTIVYLPVVVSTVVVALIGLLLFDESIGIVNGVLADLGVGPVSWQSDGTLAMISVMLIVLWTRVGFALLIYLAALQDVDPEMLEAARVDGAGPWVLVRRMIVPTLRPTTFFLVVVNIIWSFQIFDIVYVMTNGGPGYSTTMLVTYAYDQGFGPARNFGYGAAVGVVLFLLTLLVTLLQLRGSRRHDPSEQS